MKVSLPCGHCGGSGRKEAPALTATLALLRKQKNWRTADMLAQALSIKVTAMLNRLADLEKLGLVKRRGVGSRYAPYEWRATRELGPLTEYQHDHKLHEMLRTLRGRL